MCACLSKGQQQGAHVESKDFKRKMFMKGTLFVKIAKISSLNILCYAITTVESP